MAVAGGPARGVPILFIVFFLTDVALSQPLMANLIALAAALWLASSILLAGSALEARALR